MQPSIAVLITSLVCSVLPSPTPPPPALHPRGFLDETTTEDYDNLDPPDATTTPAAILTGAGGGGGGGGDTGPPPGICDYDVCRENQTACSKLAAATGCLCPGVSSYRDPPEPPVLKSVSSEGGELTVRWCAPYSSVDAYMVTVGGEDRGRFGEERRRGALRGVPIDTPGPTRVCVVAVNDWGRSAEVPESCTMYRPGDGGNGTPWLRAGLIGGALGLLVLVSLALLIWRNRRRKAQAGISS